VLAVFLPGTVVSVVILGFVAPKAPVSVSLPMGAVPLLSAPWTTPTGDNDGLWVSIFPVLISWIAALIVVAFGVQVLLERRREKPHPASIRRPWILAAEVLVVTLAVSGAVRLHTVVLAGPWSDLRSQLLAYPMPNGFAAVGWEREGSSRCSSPGCEPRLGLAMRSVLNVEAACQTLTKSLQGWPGTSALSDDRPIDAPENGYWEKCAYVTSQRSAGETREVQAAVAAPPGRAVEVTVRLLEACELTC